MKRKGINFTSLYIAYVGRRWSCIRFFLPLHFKLYIICCSVFGLDFNFILFSADSPLYSCSSWIWQMKSQLHLVPVMNMSIELKKNRKERIENVKSNKPNILRCAINRCRIYTEHGVHIWFGYAMFNSNSLFISFFLVSSIRFSTSLSLKD